jgi:membrane-associated PAP2 superfamily phosphatase
LFWARYSFYRLLIVTYRRYWLPEIIGVGVVFLLATLPFWSSPVDITVAGWFYDQAEYSNPWFLGTAGFSRFFFWVAPWLTVALGLLGLWLLAVGIVRDANYRFRLYGLFLFLAVIIGPGLVINAAFKDHWDRPRPRDVQVFGGEELYVPPLALGESGNSFPCGHCSSAFAWGGLYLIWRRRHPARAGVALAASIIVGVLMGVARMAAGGHFLSDVLWSAVLVWSTLLFLYWIIMRIPWREDDPARYPSLPNPRGVSFFKLALIALIAAAGVLFTFRLY